MKGEPANSRSIANSIEFSRAAYPFAEYPDSSALADGSDTNRRGPGESLSTRGMNSIANQTPRAWKSGEAAKLLQQTPRSSQIAAPAYKIVRIRDFLDSELAST